MERLSVADAGWLLIEERERPMHVGGLQLFELPEDAPPDFLHRQVEQARGHTTVRPPFNRRLARPYGRAGLYHWVEDEVELDYHFRHLALPAPGRIRELLHLVSAMHANLLDRHRPLWEFYLVEGIRDGRVAAYTKVSHALLDGVAAIRQVLKAFTPDPDARDLPPPWAAVDEPSPGLDAADAEAGADAGAGANPLSLATSLLRTATSGVSAGIGVARAVATQIARSPFDAATVAPFQAPASMLNVKLTPARRFVAQSYDFDRIRTVGKALDATVNDVVLAMCSKALRTYLEANDALPEDPLIALVPVSFRRDDSASGNAISLVPANLATHMEDPEARLNLIQASMNRAKERLADMTPTELVNYGIVMTAPIILGQLTGLSGRIRPSYNLVISNVPGPDVPLYWNGIRMTGLYPLSLLTEGYAINITQTSYAGSMEFGITADRRAMPHVQRLIDDLEDALDELERLAGI